MMLTPGNPLFPRVDDPDHHSSTETVAWWGRVQLHVLNLLYAGPAFLLL